MPILTLTVETPDHTEIVHTDATQWIVEPESGLIARDDDGHMTLFVPFDHILSVDAIYTQTPPINTTHTQ